jgi:hypothetical protein
MINLERMYDLHVHPALSLQKRRFTALEAVKLAGEEKNGRRFVFPGSRMKCNNDGPYDQRDEFPHQSVRHNDVERGGWGIEPFGGPNRLVPGNKADPDADLTGDFLKNPIKIKDGYLELGKKPGLGMEIDEKAFQKCQTA